MKKGQFEASKYDMKKSKMGKKISSSKRAGDKDKNSSFEDFKSFVRILRLKHRKNFMIFQSQSFYEDQYRTRMIDQLELKTRQLRQAIK